MNIIFIRAIKRISLFDGRWNVLFNHQLCLVQRYIPHENILTIALTLINHILNKYCEYLGYREFEF